MRIIQFIFKSLLILGGSLIILALLSREAILFWAVSQVQTDLKVLRSQVIQGSTERQCLDRGSVIFEGQRLATAQLRFTSPAAYQIEIVCDQYQLTPIVIKENTLPPFVKKKTGKSGIIYSDGQGEVALELFGRQRVIYVEDKTIGTRGKEATDIIGPQTNCSGYGFTCCAAESEVGVSDQLSNATDCPLSCYNSCQKRPVLLSVSAEPYIDSRSRIASVPKGEPFNVHFSVQPGVGQSLTVSIDFGDGTVEQLNSAQGTVTHTYVCASDTCQYSARVTVVDDLGVTAATVPHDSFQVIVHR